MKARATLPLLLALCACRGAPGTPSVLVSDSAGVRIVRYAVQAAAPLWHVDTAASVVVGAADDTLNLFGVGTALELGDGEIVVADGGNHRVLFFDASGKLERSVGRRGEGPGEFEDVDVVSDAWPDSLLVCDRMLRRVSVFDHGGTFVRSFRLATTDSVTYPFVSGVYADGSFAVSNAVIPVSGSMRTGRQSFRLWVYHYDRDGGYVGETGRLYGGETYFVAFAGGFTVAPVLFGTRTYRLVSKSRLVFVSSDRYELRYYRPDGTLTQIVRRAALARPLTSAERTVEEDRLVAREPEARRPQLRKTLASEDVPDRLPEIHAVESDGLGRIWVQAFMPGAAQAREPWWVYAPDGTLLGRIVLPPAFRLTDAGQDFVLGVRTDSLGVESVVRMPLSTS